ncbi:hypothetical protein AURDEDRAFT_167787 [Auricularia subglabra TFB-10046 SS5]|nr:hypothetical protein AURDEDRAFT_167787 [Auricularia subglabra TFB-10046 SS5]
MDNIPFDLFSLLYGAAEVGGAIAEKTGVVIPISDGDRGSLGNFVDSAPLPAPPSFRTTEYLRTLFSDISAEILRVIHSDELFEDWARKDQSRIGQRETCHGANAFTVFRSATRRALGRFCAEINLVCLNISWAQAHLSVLYGQLWKAMSTIDGIRD